MKTYTLIFSPFGNKSEKEVGFSEMVYAALTIDRIINVFTERNKSILAKKVTDSLNSTVLRVYFRTESQRNKAYKEANSILPGCSFIETDPVELTLEEFLEEN